MAGAPIGNKNATKAKPWRDALDKAIKQYENNTGPDPIKRGQVLSRIAKKVIENAMAGDKDAWQEIGNRLDGRPAQSVTVMGDEDNPISVNLPMNYVDPKPRD